MKRGILLFLVLLFFVIKVQGQLVDNFSDGDFTTNPTWVGDDSLFIVNASGELQLADSNFSNTTTYIGTPSKAIKNAVWEFKFRCKFSPSSSNFASIYLVSDKADITNQPSGYYVQIGSESGTADKATLYKSINGVKSAIITGRDSTVGTNPEGWIKVSRDSIGNWELFLDTSANKNGYISEGIANNSDIILSNYFGIQCKYTSTRKYLFFFDSILVKGSYYTDTTRPKLMNLSVLNKNNLALTFSEKIENQKGLDATNYAVNNSIGSPTILNYNGLDSTVILMSFTSPFLSGTNYQLTVQNIEDKSGNVIKHTQKQFTYVKLDTAKTNEVQINEIMADPNPPVALPANVDWVEIYNTTNKTFSLDGWTFWDKTTTTKDGLPNEILYPKEYAVLCKKSDSALLAPFAGRLILMESFPALNIDDEIITLKNQFGDTIDQVNYFKTWYGSEDTEDGGFSLEKTNPNHPCSGNSNWSASDGLDGGTPGYINSIFDTTSEKNGPKLTKAIILDLTTVELHFSKKIDSLQLKNIVVLGLSVSKVSVFESQSSFVTLTLNNPIKKGEMYNVSVSGITDCFGNSITNDELLIGLGKTPTTHQIVFNEIFAIPDLEINPLFEFEFVELYNTSNELISLDDCYFSDLSSSSDLSGAIMASNEYLVICKTTAVFELSKYGNVIGVSNFPSLNNSDDVITLTCKNQEIHSVAYSNDWFSDEQKQGGGWSLEQRDPLNPCAESINWDGSKAENKATPAQKNSIEGIVVDDIAPAIVTAYVVNDKTLWITFNETISLTDSTSISAFFSPSLDVSKIVLENTKALTIEFDEPILSQTIYTVTLSGVKDCTGNEMFEGEAKFGLPDSSNANDIIINEILFNPFSDAKTDFLEIYNRSEKIIDINGWTIATFNESKDTLDGFQTITSDPYLMFPGQFVLISKSSADIITHYKTRDEKTFIQIDVMPSYPNEIGNAVLLNKINKKIDQVNYSSDQHHVIIKNKEGISLERLDPNRSSNDKTNWHSAAKSVGYATPGVQNSQFIESDNFSDFVELEQQTFSPDNDGFNDVLNINYNFDNVGNIANIKILDTDGRQIYILVQNEILASSGTITWDGETDNGTKAQSGMYIIYFNVFDNKGQTQAFNKICVLALKL